MFKIENLFAGKIEQERFQLIAALILFGCDLGNVLYIQTVFLAPSALEPMVGNSLALSGQVHLLRDPEFLEAFSAIFATTFKVFMLVFLINNSVFYFLFSKGKSLAIKFVKGYSFFGFILTLYNCFVPRTNNIGWIVFLILTTIAYFYVYLGVKFFFKKKNQEQ